MRGGCRDEDGERGKWSLRLRREDKEYKCNIFWELQFLCVCMLGGVTVQRSLFVNCYFHVYICSPRVFLCELRFPNICIIRMAEQKNSGSQSLLGEHGFAFPTASPDESRRRIRFWKVLRAETVQ